MPFMLPTVPQASSRGMTSLSLPLQGAVSVQHDRASAASFRALLLQQMTCILHPSALDSADPLDAVSSSPSVSLPTLLALRVQSDPRTRPRQEAPATLVRASDLVDPATRARGSRQVRHSQVRCTSTLTRPNPPTHAPADVKAALPEVPSAQAASSPSISAAEAFLNKLAGVAKGTAEALGLSPHLLLAQAALETGWGRKTIKDEAGQESYNLFGIKAGGQWTGKTVAATTTEYSHGVAQTKVESFRVYGSYAESFADYAQLIQHRYGSAMANGATADGFGKALQAKGYATDPNYAQKIARVAQSVAYRLASRPEGTPAAA